MRIENMFKSLLTIYHITEILSPL